MPEGFHNQFAGSMRDEAARRWTYVRQTWSARQSPLSRFLTLLVLVLLVGIGSILLVVALAVGLVVLLGAWLVVTLRRLFRRVTNPPLDSRRRNVRVMTRHPDRGG